MGLLALKYFMAVAESGHVTRSAEKLHISQPSLSQSIRRLEEELGVPLFRRQGRSIVLTEYGQYLSEALRPLLQRLDTLPGQLREMAESADRTVRLHVMAASQLVAEAVIAYRREHEPVNFQFLLGEDEGPFDLSVESMLGTPEEDDRTEHFVCREEIFLAVPRASRYAREPAQPLSCFAGADFISLISHRQFRQSCDRLCARAGFRPRIVFESDSPDTVRNMIPANMGVGFWPACSWGELQRENAVLVTITEPPCRRNIVIRRSKTPAASPAAEDFYRFLCAYMLGRMRDAYSGDEPLLFPGGVL